MATTRYLVAATPNWKAKIMSNIRSARREADLRATGDRVDVVVTTVVSGKVTYVAQGAPLTGPAPEPVQEDAQDDTAPAQDDPPAPAAEDGGGAFSALLAEVKAGAAARTHAVRKAAPKKAAKATRGGRASLGEAAAPGWELLYDKPGQHAQVGRKSGQYGLICTTHGTVHPVARLVDERAARKAGGWCTECPA